MGNNSLKNKDLNILNLDAWFRFRENLEAVGAECRLQDGDASSASHYTSAGPKRKIKIKSFSILDGSGRRGRGGV